MKYLLDTNILFSQIDGKTTKHSDLYITEDVAEECISSPERLAQIKVVGITTLEIKKKHLEKLKEVLKDHAHNLGLIRLYSGKGKADVTMLAYILAEREKPQTLFYMDDDYALVSKDKILTEIAQSYGINCLLDVL